MGLTDVEKIRDLYEGKVLATNIPRWGKFSREDVGILLAEIDRLRGGDFTKEELNNLCHNIHEKGPCSREEFASECLAFQDKLFGKS